MKKLRGSAGWIFVTLVLVVFFVAIYGGIPKFSLPATETANPPSLITREVIEYSLTAEQSSAEAPTIPANKLPEFSFDLNAPKFQEILQSSGAKVKEYVSTEIQYSGEQKGDEKIEAVAVVNAEKHALIVHPKDMPNFKPGKYRLSLKLRTLEGEVNIEQDFTWGVIAVNTDKSIYKPGDVATVGMGVLNNKGETQCKTGENAAKVWLTITDPDGKVKEYSTENNSIKDSGECGPITVTNQPDFVSIYLISGPGIYKMHVTAEVDGEKRSIEDYFKAAQDSAFDIERTSFPTRIYPKAEYEVLFTVTSKEDYKGNIEEFMPSDFKLEKISDNGKEQTVGEFKKITWNVDLKKGEAKKFTYIIHFPQVSPEFYLLGPITIADFKEARQWQIASDDINSTSGLVSYEDNGGPNTFSRVWTGTDWSPALTGAGDTLDTSPGDSRWFREVSSPKTGEKLVALVDQDGGDAGTDDELYVFRWSGSAWTQDLASPTTSIDLASAAMDTTRGFDIAYEDLSGDALFVYSDGASSQLLYYKRVSGTWDASPSNAGTAYDVYKRWVRLEPQLGSDTILVGYLNNNERVGAMLWDGSTNSFSNQFADDVGTATATSDEQAFDIAWETSSGTPMVFWGGAASNNLIYREYTGGSWQAEVGSALNTFTTDVDWIMAGSDPVSTSNNIALGIQESAANPICRFAVWTGSSVTFNGTTATCVENDTNNLIDTAFENTGGVAMFVYVPNNGANDDDIAWLEWTSGGGFTSATTETMNPDIIEAVQLTSDLNTTSMMLLFHDNAGDLFHLEWNGVSWTTIGTAVYDNIMAAADDSSVPYGFGFDRNLETMAAYRWFENNNGTSVVNALTAQDNPYTLTTGSQQFRLRLLLYYPDSLPLNGRSYILQFVDKGTGTCDAPTGGTPATWTDVAIPGTPGSTEISYYDNASPADGANLTANGGDPTYSPYTKVNQDYEEGTAVSNPLYFTNSVSAMTGDQVGLWDFSLIDNTTFDVNPQTFCFRVVRSNGIVLQIDKYPQISTASVNDVLIQSGSLIQSGTLLQ